MRNSFLPAATFVVCGLMTVGSSSAELGIEIGAERPELASISDLGQATDRVLEILASDEITNEEHSFFLSLPKEAIPLMTQRLEQRIKGNAKGSDPFSLLTFKLKQFDGEIPGEMRRAAIDVLIATCESDDDSRLLMHLSGLRGLKDPKITEMALRMKTRTDTNVQKATAKLLATIDGTPTSVDPPGPSVANNTSAPTPIANPSQATPAASQSPTTPIAAASDVSTPSSAFLWTGAGVAIALLVGLVVFWKLRA